ncbi:MAG TPA: hypothetical protein VGR95_16695 [Thermoanaerobaculia bacterium]|nr:hypothetical protein [Thermoanaerobaculia bacterium]
MPETKVSPPSTDFVSPKADNDDVGTDPLERLIPRRTSTPRRSGCATTGVSTS